MKAFKKRLNKLKSSKITLRVHHNRWKKIKKDKEGLCLKSVTAEKTKRNEFTSAAINRIRIQVGRGSGRNIVLCRVP